MSRSKACTAPSRCRTPRASGGNGGRLSGRRFWSASATWTPATGAPTSRAGRSSNTACSGWWRWPASWRSFLQVISARLGVATGKDLAQCCRDWYPHWTRWPNWIAMEIAIGATDLAESLGSAVALNLLFHIPLSWAIIITAFDVLLLAGVARAGHEDARSGGDRLRGDHWRLLWHRDLRAAADAAGFPGDGPGPDPSQLSPERHARGGHRHDRRHRHAAQPLPALGAGAVAQAAAR